MGFENASTRSVTGFGLRRGGAAAFGARSTSSGLKELTKEKRMLPAGLKAFAARIQNKSGIYSYEQRRAELEEPYNSRFRRNRSAWDFFQAQPPSYRKMLSWYVMSAKKEETRSKRFEKLMKASAKGKRL
jgi:uncharacterized protein YdeI (YjbR/CyaY-like superfamily)